MPKHHSIANKIYLCYNYIKYNKYRIDQVPFSTFCSKLQGLDGQKHRLPISGDTFGRWVKEKEILNQFNNPTFQKCLIYDIERFNKDTSAFHYNFKDNTDLNRFFFQREHFGKYSAYTIRIPWTVNILEACETTDWNSAIIKLPKCDTMSSTFIDCKSYCKKIQDSGIMQQQTFTEWPRTYQYINPTLRKYGPSFLEYLKRIQNPSYGIDGYGGISHSLNRYWDELPDTMLETLLIKPFQHLMKTIEKRDEVVFELMPFQAEILYYSKGAAKSYHTDPVAFKAVITLTIAGSGGLELINKSTTGMQQPGEGYILCGDAMTNIRHRTIPSTVNEGRVVLICHFVDAAILNNQIESYTSEIRHKETQPSKRRRR